MFVGRRKEMEMLSRISDVSHPQFVRIYGRRRIGKTELLLHGLADHEGFFFNVDEADRNILFRALGEQLAAQTDHVARSYRWWSDFLDDIERTHPKFVVLDEFQNLVRGAKEVLSEIQHRWDMRWKRTGPSLVICGSSIGMLQKVTSARGAPLYGRLTQDVHLRGLDYGEVREMYLDASEEERVARYAIFGGTPFYHQFGQAQPLREAVQRSFLSKGSPLLDEPENLLRSELKDPTRYNSLLREIGRGHHSLADLESSIGSPHGGLGWYLQVLETRMDLVKKDEPLLGQNKFARYSLTDPFFRFFYRFVFPNRSMIEMGRGDQLLDLILQDLNGHIGQEFEGIAREAIARSPSVKGIPLDLRAIGGWWSRKGDEIDILAVGPKDIWAGEVKWSSRPEGVAVVHRLMEKVDLIGNKGGRRVRPFMVSRSGVTPEAEEALDRVGGFSLDLAEVVALFPVRPTPAPDAQRSGPPLRTYPEYMPRGTMK